MKKYFSLLLMLLCSLATNVQAQSYYEDEFYYLYDYDHRVVVRKCVEASYDYQDLWNGDYVRVINDYVYIYRDGYRVTYGNRIWLEHTGYYTVQRGDYFYLVDSNGYNTGLSGNNIYALWNGVYVVKHGNYWQLYDSEGYRIGNAYSPEEITIYWNGYYCVAVGSYYYIYGPDGYRVGSIYSDDVPSLTNAGYFRCRHGNSSYLYDTDGFRVY